MVPADHVLVDVVDHIGEGHGGELEDEQIVDLVFLFNKDVKEQRTSRRISSFLSW